jgi:outer membrane protein assembly factor BamB
LYFGSDDGCVHAIQAADGSVVWKTATAGRVRAQPALNGDTLIVPSDDGKLYALKTADGRVVWSVEIDPKPVARSLPSADGQSQWDYAAASPLVVGDLILVGSASGDFLALELQTGRERWRCRSGAPIRAQAAVCAGRVVFGNWAGRLYALNISSGTQAWQFNARMPVVSRPAVSGQDVVVGSRYSYLWSIDANTGYMNWAFNYWWSWVESSAVVEGARAYVGSSDARAVFAIDCKMGRSLWRTRVSGYPWAAPAVSNGQVFIPTISGAKDTVPQGFLYVLSAADGRIQRKLEIPTGEGCFLNGSCTQPVLTRRFVIIGATDGCLHAFRR